MVVWHAFFEFEACQTAIIVCSGLPHLTQLVKILKKVRQTAIKICSLFVLNLHILQTFYEYVQIIEHAHTFG
jgi:hypothetical protein